VINADFVEKKFCIGGEETLQLPFAFNYIYYITFFDICQCMGMDFLMRKKWGNIKNSAEVSGGILQNFRWNLAKNVWGISIGLLTNYF
jgi:hypothetical protein